MPTYRKIAIITPQTDWMMRYQLAGGGYTDFQDSFAERFPNLDIHFVIPAQGTNKIEVLPMEEAPGPDQPIYKDFPAGLLDEVHDFVVAKITPWLKEP
ncbi:MAG TPA: hypothetical protein VL133_00565 [Devosia sp.]|nr:hypothetical protein [Devosia sp.]